MKGVIHAGRMGSMKAPVVSHGLLLGGAAAGESECLEQSWAEAVAFRKRTTPSQNWLSFPKLFVSHS